MKLYLDPRSEMSRPILMFFHEHERMADWCAVEVASQQLSKSHPDDDTRDSTGPVLIDGDLVLSQSPAILRYLADRCASTAYPLVKRPRARIDAAMDWVHSDLTRDLCHGLLYPRHLSSYRHEDVQTQAEVEARGYLQAAARLKQLDAHLRGEGFAYLCGDEISIADYTAAGVLGYADASGFSLADWPRVLSWLRLMKSRPSWAPTHFALRGPGSCNRRLDYVARAA